MTRLFNQGLRVPIDARSGVYFELHGTGEPLLLGFPVMASFSEIFGVSQAMTRQGFLDRLSGSHRVLLIDYPSIGRSASIDPQALTIERVAADLLSVADAAGFDRFAYWGYTFGAAVGLYLGARTDRLTALVIGGWTPLGGPYAEMLQGALIHIDDPPAHARVVLRNPAQYAQWATFWRSLQGWSEAAENARIRCPRLVYAGALGDTDAGGVPIRYASTLRERRAELETLGWTVLLFEDQGHGVGLEPSIVVPPIRDFLERRTG